jgi:hypothetical protein
MYQVLIVKISGVNNEKLTKKIYMTPL